MKTLLLFVFLLGYLSIQAQDSLWSRVYIDGFPISGKTADKAIDDGFVAIADAGVDGVIFRCDSLGNQLWSRRITSITTQTLIDDIKATHDSCFVISGRRGDGVTGYDDVIVVKMNDNGDTLWTRSFEYNAKASSTLASKLHICNDSSILLVWGNATDMKHFIQNIDNDGNPIWSNVINHGSNNVIACIAQDDADNFYLGEGVSQWNWGNEGKLIKTNSTGDVIWATNYTNQLFDDMLFIDTQLVVLGKHLGMGGYTMTYLDSSGTIESNFAYTWLYWDQVHTRASMLYNGDQTISFMNNSPMIGMNVLTKTDYNGNILAADLIEIEGRKLLPTKNNGLYVVGVGPIYGIKSFTPHMGVYRLDSAWSDVLCNWDYGIADSMILTVSGNPYTCTQTTGIIETSSEVEGTVYWLNDYMGCVDFIGSLDEQDELVVKVYPNVSNGLLNFEASEFSEYHLIVFDNVGRVHLNEKFNGYSWLIDLSEESSGMYTYIVTNTSNNKTIGGKIVLMK